MTTRILILGVSAICAGAAIIDWYSNPEVKETICPSHDHDPIVVEKESPAGRGASKARTFNASAGGESNLWETVETDDMSEFVANLREVGCPEQVVQDLVTLRLARRYRGKLMALIAAEAPDWRDLAHPPARRTATVYARERSALLNAMDKELERLLGVDPKHLKYLAVHGQKNPLADRFLPLHKEMRIREITELYWRLSNEVRKELEGVSDSEIQERLRALEQERDSEIAAVLTPLELRQHVLRHSAPAHYARLQLPVARDEAEFETMVEAVRESGIVGARTSSDNPASWPDSEAFGQMDAEKALQHRLLETLGEVRYAELFPQAEQAGE